jgi:hypothetical protein
MFLTILTTDETAGETRSFQARYGLAPRCAPVRITTRGIRFELYHSTPDAINLGPDSIYLTNYLDRILILISLQRPVHIGRFLHQTKQLLLGRLVHSALQLHGSPVASKIVLIVGRTDEQALQVLTPDSLAQCGLPAEVSTLLCPFTMGKAHSMVYASVAQEHRRKADSEVIDCEGNVWTVMGGGRGCLDEAPPPAIPRECESLGDPVVMQSLVSTLVNERVQASIQTLVAQVNESRQANWATAQAMVDWHDTQQRTDLKLNALHADLDLVNSKAAANEAGLTQLRELTQANAALLQQLLSLHIAQYTPSANTHPTPQPNQTRGDGNPPPPSLLDPNV